jgi:hypothetical protein
LNSIVFPCISTGIFNFPNRKAADIALNTVRTWLEVNSSHIEQIIFCTYEDNDFQIYKELLPEYFPVSDESKNIAINPTAVIELENLPSSSTSTQTLTSARKSNLKISNDSTLDERTSTVADNVNVSDAVTDDIVNRKFPVQLENEANVCFFNSICQIFYSIPEFLAKLKFTATTNNVVMSMQDILEKMKVSDYVTPYTYINRIGLNNYVFGSQQGAPEVLNQIINTIYSENSISPFCVTLIEPTYCSDLPCEHKIDKRESHQTLPIEVVDTEQQSVQGLLNVKNSL